MWESGAIITYLVEQYDKAHVLSYDTLKEKHLCNQWRKADLFVYLKSLNSLVITRRKVRNAANIGNISSGVVHFQMSGQGPYFGQAGWFNVLHAEKLPSAIERYQVEVRRIQGVLDGQLEGREWLVGDKMTYADLAFAPWNDRTDALLQCAAEDKFQGFPNLKAWHERVTGRESWAKAMAKREVLMDEQGLDWHGMPKGMKNMAEYQAKIKAEEKAG